ncbi:unnamed protein product [Gongylonema pulchrum]|uniref:GuKc domain-containing protein n=1 Tax=Gongylonema pulchrum TaxID=637853 RepID=A0A183D5M3_9BILA|nr:unnamed protein product [Gongylonema pulchrum]
MLSPNSGIRPPPSYPTAAAFGVMSNYRAPYQTGATQTGDYPNCIITPKSEPDVMQMCSGPPTPSSGRPGSSSSTEWQYRGGRAKRRRREEDNSYDECKRPALLGDIAIENLATQFERDIYSVVDHLITQAVIMVDGAEAARKSGMLKRLLESQPGKMFASQRPPLSSLEFNS